jgi:hypothetical protein
MWGTLYFFTLLTFCQVLHVVNDWHVLDLPISLPELPLSQQATGQHDHRLAEVSHGLQESDE